MAETFTLYNNYIHVLPLSKIDLSGDTIKVMLVSGYTPNFATHTTRADVEAKEVSGSGYTAGGATVSVSYPAFDDANLWQLHPWPGYTWNPSTISADGAVYYKSLGGASNADLLIGYHDFDGTKTSSSGPLKIDTGNVAKFTRT